MTRLVMLLAAVLAGWSPAVGQPFPTAPMPTVTEYAQPPVVYAQPSPVVRYVQPQVVYSQPAIQYAQQPVYQQSVGNVCPDCGRVHGPARNAVRAIGGRINSGPRAGDGYSLEFAAPGYEDAYQACLRDCQYYAAGNRYPGRFGGHPPSNLIRGLKAGTGYSHDMNRPNTCYYREGHQLVARARLRGPDGKVWWSARYR